MLYDRPEFLKEIEETIVQVKQALEAREKGVPGDGTVEELQKIKLNLERMRDEVASDTLPSKANRVSSMGWIITDTWSLRSLLGDRIIGVEHKYRKL